MRRLVVPLALFIVLSLCRKYCVSCCRESGHSSSRRQAFFPIIAVCAGGTIGNFGELEAANDEAQDLVFAHYLRPADASLVTFLDPQRVETSLAAYSSFGGRTGMYDGQEVCAYVLSGRKNRLVESWTVPFSNGQAHAAAKDVIRLANSMGKKPFWLKLDMIRKGEKVGQVTRHYSERYARSRFLGNADSLNVQPCGRAYITTFGDGPPAGIELTGVAPT